MENNKTIYIKRFELISDSGREKTIYCKDAMYFQLQDGGTTLKVFYQDKNVVDLKTFYQDKNKGE